MNIANLLQVVCFHSFSPEVTFIQSTQRKGKGLLVFKSGSQNMLTLK